ncbi:hypothetical protein Tco_0496206 [Tanacetum coccineum]
MRRRLDMCRDIQVLKGWNSTSLVLVLCGLLFADMQHVTTYVLWKPSRDFTRPLRPPSGLKGLLHTLNATVIPTNLYRLCTGCGARTLIKLRGIIPNWSSRMLYRRMMKLPMMVDVARRNRLGAWLRA